MSTSSPTMAFNSRIKRGSSEDSIGYNSPESPASTLSIVSFQEAKLRGEEDLGRYSPRAVVAGRLGELAIQGDNAPTHQIPNGSLQYSPPFQSTQSSGSSSFHEGTCDLHNMPDLTPGSSLNDEMDLLDRDRSTPFQVNANSQPQHQNIKSPTKSPRKTSSLSPRKKRNVAATSKVRNARGSPPLAGENPLTWSDTEITGHNPTDPNDDGYGINGIGFKPTAAMAWARSQKRQKQVAEWKVREAKEARERRRERRDGHELDKIRTIHKGAIQKRVKFDV